jgi:predicted nucleotidyltransferase
MCPAGSVGVVVKAPVDTSHSYRVRLPGGTEVALSRHDLTVFTRYQEEGLRGLIAAEDQELFDYVIYRCVVGSRAYGLDEEGSDVDRRGICLPPADMHWSLGSVPEQLERDATQEVYWELQKFVSLALKANPNVLECLYTPLVEMADPLAHELLAERGRFLSKMVYQTYNGYVMSQFKKMEQDLRTRGEIRWKHAMHLIRLLLSGITVLKEGFVPVQVSEYRDRLLAVRRGEVEWEKVNEWRLDLHREFDAAYAATHLPDQPDYEWADRFVVKARRSMVDVNMLAPHEQDYQPLNTFPLAWRWTDPRYNVLPPDVLSDIRPLTVGKARVYAAYWPLESHRSEADGLMPLGYRLVDRIETSRADAEDVRNWLAARIAERAAPVITFWGPDEAAETTAGIFCRYWDHFCRSEDVDILPLHGDWVLVHWHEDYFFFGKRSE